MTHVKLMGELGEKFGSDWHMNVKTTREIFKLIDCQKEGFKDYILDCGKKGINFTAQNGEDLLDYVIRKKGLSDPINKKDKKDKLSKRSNKHVKMILK